MVLGRPTPDPGLSPQVELPGGDASGLLDLIRVGKALSSQSIAAEEAPPALLQVKPACPSGNEDLMEPRMLSQPGAGLGTIVAGEVVGDDENVARRTARSWEYLPTSAIATPPRRSIRSAGRR